MSGNSRLSFVCAVAAGMSQPAYAQTQDKGGQANQTSGWDEIVVTAQRREESSQRAAISLDTIGSTQLARTGLTSADDLTQLVPALRTDPAQGPYLNFTVRGVANFGVNAFADGAILLSSDGVAQSHPVSANGLFFDLERVEVLKGPQGTLYGRNATGGAVNLISKRPDWKLGGSASIEYGNYDRKVANLAANVPLSDKFAARIAFQRVDRDGYFSDDTGDENSIAARLSLRFEPTSTLRFLAVGDISRDQGRGVGTSLLTTRAVPPTGPSTGEARPTFGPYVGLFDPVNAPQFIASGSAPRNFLPLQNNKFKGVLLQTDLDTGVGTFTLLSAYRDAHVLFLSSFPTFYLGEDTHSRQYSAELRLASANDRPLRYVIGAYYLDDALSGRQPVEVNATISNQSINTKTQSAAAFGQLTYAFSNAFRLVGGIRYTSEKKETDSRRYRIAPFDFATTPLYPFPAADAGIQNLALDRSRRFNATTWKAGVEWDAAPDSLVYANVSTGFKAGGFFFGPPDKSSYEPEHVTAYLLGSKNRFFDRKVQVNAELFYLDYRDQQISYFGFTSAGSSFVTENVGKASIYGAELDLQWLATDTTRFGLNVQWQEGKYDRFSYLSSVSVSDTQTCPFTAVSTGGFRLDCSGRRVLQLPEWIIAGSFQQRFPFGRGASLVFDVNSRYETGRETSLNYLPEARVGSYTRTDASLTLNGAEGHWSLTLYVKNIEDDAVAVRVQPGRSYSIANGGLLSANYQAPRTYGVRAGFKF